MNYVSSFEECLDTLGDLLRERGIRPANGSFTEAFGTYGGFMNARRFVWGKQEGEHFFDLSALQVGNIYIVSLLEPNGKLRKVVVKAGTRKEEVARVFADNLLLQVDSYEKGKGEVGGESNTLDRLPDPVLVDILGFLPLKDVAQCFHVARGLYTVSRSSELWKVLYDRGRAQPALKVGSRDDVIKRYQESKVARMPVEQPARTAMDPWPPWGMLDYFYFDYM